MEYETIRKAIEDLIILCDARQITEDGEPIYVEGLQSLYQERIYALADLLGMEEVYLKQPMSADSGLKSNREE